jgi:uncharacterized protein DUF488
VRDPLGRRHYRYGQVEMAEVVWTIGHSIRSLEGFLDLLAENRIEAVADVRRYPGSRRWPHFAQMPLAMALEKRGLVYMWFPELGGRRTPRSDSPNTAWRNAAFRGYADYMATETFAEGSGARSFGRQVISWWIGTRDSLILSAPGQLRAVSMHLGPKLQGLWHEKHDLGERRTGTVQASRIPCPDS